MFKVSALFCVVVCSIKFRMREHIPTRALNDEASKFSHSGSKNGQDMTLNKADVDLNDPAYLSLIKKNDKETLGWYNSPSGTSCT